MSGDEITTFAVANLHSWSAIWRADANNADGMPPLYHYVEGLALRIPIRREIALRIPSIIGFSVLLPSLFVFVSHRLGERSGSVSAYLPLVTHAYWYSYEARNYALTLGLMGITLVIWQKIRRLPGNGWRAILLFFLLAVASGISYNAVYGLAALFFAEIVAFVRTRRINWLVLGALFFGLLPFLAYGPIIKEIQQYYGPGFWSKPSLGVVVETVYSWADQTTAAFLFLLMTAGAMALFWFPGPQFRKDPERQVPPEEWALSIGFCGIPGVIFVVSSILKGGMVPRYSICMIIGVALLVAYASRWFKSSLSDAIIACAITAFLLLATWGLRSIRDPEEAAWKEHSVLRQYLDGLTPIVISNGITYMQLAYYSPPETRSHLYYIADPVQALRFLHTDTVDLSVPVVARYLPLQVTNYQDFISKHQDYLVYAGSEWDWLDPYLLEKGESLQLLLKTGGGTVHRVKPRLPPKL